MARVDDLVEQVREERLRRELAAAVAELKKRQRFGLVFEEHLPETTVLDKLPIETGATVVKRSDLTGRAIFRVCEIADGNATLEPTDGGAAETLPTTDLLTVKRFGEPIYPSLTKLGETRRGDEDRPAHAVINGENFHALQLLLYLYEGQADCIYIDPPYNTGARDWKYNNRYVDGNDAWRHSKWLSMMSKRLKLCRRLLKPDGVLIVTIDEHEVHHLGMLLEQEFPDAYRQMVTIVINPKGVTQERFSRVDEYAFFCFLGDSTAIGKGDDLLTPGADDEEMSLMDDVIRRPRWKGLLRSGTNARREDRKKMFFPVLVDTNRKAIVGTGEPLPYCESPDLTAKIGDYATAWPIRTDGSFGNWGVGHTTLRQLIAKGYVALGEYDHKRRTYGISYLSKEPQEQIASGVLEIAAFDEEKNVVDVRYAEVANRRLKTVWHRSRHDAGVGGSDILKAYVGSRVFQFPKSVYAVRDCLAAVTRNRPDALILDLFAGSGTTYHATCLLNAEDNGRRRSVMVTNNEVDAETTAKLHREGLYYRGDPEFEKHGIFEQATRPRCEAVTNGKRADGTPVPGTHIGGRSFAKGFEENIAFFRLDYLDPDAVELGYQFWAIASALWLASGGVGAIPQPVEDGTGYFLPPASPFAVLFYESKFRAFADALASRPDLTHVWLVTDSEKAFAEMRANLSGSLYVGMLYRDYLKNFEINTER